MNAASGDARKTGSTGYLFPTNLEMIGTRGPWDPTLRGPDRLGLPGGIPVLPKALFAFLSPQDGQRQHQRERTDQRGIGEEDDVASTRAPPA